MTNKNLKTISVPPDGGWGWVVCFAMSLSYIMIIPIFQSFGLVFKSTFVDLGMTATDTSIIINVNSAFGMMMGLVNGSLLNKFGFRKCAVLGSSLLSFGVILTAFASNFLQFFIFYGIITSLGMGLTMAAFSLALNSYFRKRRGIATGFAMTVTGIGPILMPLIISVLLTEFGTTGCVLIIGGLSLHSTMAGLLLQPLKWHMKKEIPDQELQKMNEDKEEVVEALIDNTDYTKLELLEEKPKANIDIASSTLSIDHDVETSSIYGFETPLPQRKLSNTSLLYDIGKPRKRSIFGRSLSQQDRPDWQSALSIQSQNSMKSIPELDGEIPEKISEQSEQNKLDNTQTKTDSTKQLDSKHNKTLDADNSQKEAALPPPQKKKTWTQKLVVFFDLDLLKDPIYLNLMFGMSLAIFAEINFSLLTPFILNDYNYSTERVAQIMSTVAAADIIFRFISPFIAHWLNKTPRAMYMFSLIFLIVSRTALIFAKSFQTMLIVAVMLGIAKGFRTVFMSLLIPTYVPIEKLASASGIQMVVNGVFIMIGGPILGVIRDITGSYDKCIICINFITFSTIIMWSTEFIYLKFCRKNTVK